MNELPESDLDFELDASVSSGGPEPLPTKPSARTVPAVGVRFSQPSEEFELRTDDADAEDAKPAPTWSEGTSARRLTLMQQLVQARAVTMILRAFLTSTKKLDPIGDSLAKISEQMAQQSALPQDDPRRLEMHGEIETALRAAQAQIVELERKIPPAWLRRRFEEQPFNTETVAHYLRFQLQHLESTPECWSRIDLLVTRQVRQARPDGKFAIKPASEVAELWRQCLPPAQAEEHVRRAAVNFFRNAAKRLEEFTQVEELFSSGYYVDVAGYKISLRLDYFDPPILYAAAELNIAMHNWLATQAERGRDLRAFDKEFADAHETIQKIFVRQHQDFEALQRFRARVFGKPAQPEPDPNKVDESFDGAVWKPPVNKKSFARKAVLAGAVLIAAAIAVPTGLTVMGERSRDLDAMSPSAAREFSSLLSEASTSGDPPTLLVGQLNSSSWVLLTRAQRRSQVELLLGGLRKHKMDSALLYRDGVLAVQVAGGQIRYIE